MVESTNLDITPPDNIEAIAGMQDRIDAIARPKPVMPEEDAPDSGFPS